MTDAIQLQPEFHRTYLRRFGFVCRCLAHLGVNAADLEDAVQETFVVAFRHWSEFRPEASDRAWLFGIARKIASRYRRTAQRQARLKRAYVPLESQAQAPDSRLAAREASQLLARFLDGLELPTREVFVLSRLEEMTGAQVAEALKINPNTMWSRLRAAERRLDRFALRHRAKASRIAGHTGDPLHRAREDDATARSRVWALLAAQLPGAGVPYTKIAVGVFAALLGAGGVTVGIASAGAPPRSATSVLIESTPDSRSRALTDTHSGTTSAFPNPPDPTPPTAAEPEPTPLPSSHVTAKTPRRKLEAKRTTTQAAAASASDLAAETQLLREIRTAIKRGAPNTALDAIAVHKRRYPDGILRRERQALHVRAVCAAGREPQARRLAAAMEASVPHLNAVAKNGCEALFRSTKPMQGGQLRDHDHH